MKPTFSVDIKGYSATFTDKYSDPTSRIFQFDFGDGTLFRWDTPDQIQVTHVYKKGGSYYTKAITKTNEMSDPVIVVIGETPQEKLSLWQRFINWLKGVFK